MGHLKRSDQYKNLMSILDRTPDAVVLEGKDWYRQANIFVQDLADKYKLSLYQTAAVVACLSPAVKWETNLKDAQRLIDTFYHRGYIGAKAITVSTYGAQKMKAIEVLTNRLRLSPKTGPKTYNFAHNIHDPFDPNFVTIDRHAWNILEGAMNSGSVALTTKKYNLAVDVYKVAAKSTGFLPNQIQAITWIQYRKEKGIV